MLNYFTLQSVDEQINLVFVATQLVTFATQKTF